jgi:hypothetical protein
VKCCILEAQFGKKNRLRGMFMNGRVSWINGWGKLGLRGKVGGGQFSSPGLIPGNAPFWFSPGARHAKSQSRVSGRAEA